MQRSDHKFHRLACLLLLWALARGALAELPAWNYHPWAPFMTGPDRGLAWEITRALNDQLPAEQRLEVVSIERPRLNLLLRKRESGIVLLANPAWFDDPGCRRFLVSSPLIWVRNELVSRADQPVEYDGPHSLFGKTVGFLPGFELPDIEPHIEERLIWRTNSVTSAGNLRRLLRGEIDVAIVPATQLAQLGDLRAGTHVSARAYSRVTRHLLLTTDLAPLYPHIERVLASKRFQARLRQELEGYRLGHLALKPEDAAHSPDVTRCDSP